MAKVLTQPDNLPYASEQLRPMHVGEVVKAGDYWLLNETWRLLKGPCRYDPGCCVGRTVEENGVKFARLRK